MTIRLDMRRAVARARETLGDSTDAVREFFCRHLNDDGGFAGRDGRSDLYYTVFGLEASIALDARIAYDRVANYLDSFQMGQTLDLVHLACLVRCRANMADHGGKAIDHSEREAMTVRLMHFQADDGGFSNTPDAERGTVYGSFLALGICQDLQVDALDPERLLASVDSLAMPDGGYSNEPTMKASATAPTAAAITILHYLQRPIPEAAVQWLGAQAAPSGGFAALQLPIDLAVSDLLSTATALHALALLGVPLKIVREANLDYLDSLWNTHGGFHGHLADDALDCEYTYYGLLTLGDLVES
jgi:prenyltransferase beta subunit